MKCTKQSKFPEALTFWTNDRSSRKGCFEIIHIGHFFIASVIYPVSKPSNADFEQELLVKLEFQRIHRQLYTLKNHCMSVFHFFAREEWLDKILVASKFALQNFSEEVVLAFKNPAWKLVVGGKNCYVPNPLVAIGSQTGGLGVRKKWCQEWGIPQTLRLSWSLTHTLTNHSIALILFSPYYHHHFVVTIDHQQRQQRNLYQVNTIIQLSKSL